MGGACFLQETGQTHTVPFSATFECPSAPIVLPLYHKNCTPATAQVSDSALEARVPAFSPSRRKASLARVAKGCLPNCNLVSKQYQSVLGIGASLWPCHGHTPVQAAALLWLDVMHPHSISPRITAGTTAGLLVPPRLACGDCFGFEENLIYHRYIQGFIRH